MFQFFSLLFSTSGFEPHGFHFTHTPALFWTLVVANATTFAAYVLIPIVLVWFVRKREDLVFHWVFLLFGAFIVLCGIHHLIHVITFWQPIYRTQAFFDVLMSIVSFGTFLALIPILPLALKLPSPKQLEESNTRLSREIAIRTEAERQLKENEKLVTQKNQELEVLLKESNTRKDELERMNKYMVDREVKMVELKQELAACTCCTNGGNAKK